MGVSIARTGEMTYGAGETPIDAGPEGTVIIVRDALEVFRPQTVKSFEGKSVTVLHPEELVTPVTWKEVTVGLLQNIRRGTGEQENDLVADLLITDSEAIEMVKSGLREVSCGYEADYYETGIGRGEQKNIIGNHLALVPQGRAGSGYAINDHKGKGTKMKFSEILAAIKGNKFPKTEVTALRAAANDTAIEGEDKPVADAGAYDELCKNVKDLSAKVDALSKPPAADASTQPTASQAAVVVAKDEPGAAAATAGTSMEDRMKKLEDLVASLVQKMAPAVDADKTEMEETEDADEEVEVDDADKEDKDDKGEKKKTGDAVAAGGPEDDDEDEEESDEELHSRAEILVPGIKKSQKNLKVKALKGAYATTDGKAVIDRFTPNFDEAIKNQKFVDAVFVGVSEVLKSERQTAFAKAKTHDFKSNMGQPTGAMTPEKVNEMNQKHYAAKQ